MAGFTKALQVLLLDHVLNDGTYTPESLWLALYTGTQTDDVGAGLTEVTGTGYARITTAASDWDPAVVGATGVPSSKTNAVAKTFPTAGGNWSSSTNITAFGLVNASTSGTARIFGALVVPKPVLNGDTLAFAIGALVLKFGDPTDTPY